MPGRPACAAGSMTTTGAAEMLHPHDSGDHCLTTAAARLPERGGDLGHAFPDPLAAPGGPMPLSTQTLTVAETADQIGVAPARSAPLLPAAS